MTDADDARTSILTIDGGGIRGVLPAIWLHRLQGELTCPVPECFDLVAGTSTGSILAAALGLGHTTDDVIHMYQHHATDVFPPQFGRLVGRVRRSFASHAHTRRAGEGLDRVLVQVFGHARLGDVRRATLITACSHDGHEPLVFDSRDPAHAELALRDVCRASAALPGIFSPHTMHVPGRGELALVDGGEYDRNPTVQALATELMPPRRPPASFLVGSFGTGFSTGFSAPVIEREPPRDARDLAWAVPRVRTLLSSGAPADLEDRLAASRFHRLQTDLPAELARPDAADRDAVRGLLNAAVSYLEEGDGAARIAALARDLGETPERG